MTAKEQGYLQTVYKALDDKFAADILILYIGDISVLADYFIIATGNNHIQIKAMAEEVENKLALLGLEKKHIEGLQEARWVLLDFGDILIHIFDRENREFYDLERIWGDAAPVSL